MSASAGTPYCDLQVTTVHHRHRHFHHQIPVSWPDITPLLSPSSIDCAQEAILPSSLSTDAHKIKERSAQSSSLSLASAVAVLDRSSAPPQSFFLAFRQKDPADWPRCFDAKAHTSLHQPRPAILLACHLPLSAAHVCSSRPPSRLPQQSVVRHAHQNQNDPPAFPPRASVLPFGEFLQFDCVPSRSLLIHWRSIIHHICRTYKHHQHRRERCRRHKHVSSSLSNHIHHQ